MKEFYLGGKDLFHNGLQSILLACCNFQILGQSLTAMELRGAFGSSTFYWSVISTPQLHIWIADISNLMLMFKYHTRD